MPSPRIHVLGLMILCFFFIVPLVSSPLLLSCLLVWVSISLGLLIGVWSGVWHTYVMGLVFTGGMMVMILYVTNLADGKKATSSDLLIGFAAVGGFFYLPCTTSIPLIRPVSVAVMGGLLNEVLVFGLLFLLIGLFLIVFMVDKKMGSLR